MASTYLNLKGLGFWVRVFPENRDVEGYDGELKSTGGQYVLQFAPDADSMQALVKSGSQSPDYAKTHVDDEGNSHETVKLKRQHEKYSRKGELLEWASGAPDVYTNDGRHWDVEEDGFIGNGSELECRVCVYTAGKTVGTRLESVKVLTLVEPPMKVAV